MREIKSRAWNIQQKRFIDIHKLLFQNGAVSVISKGTPPHFYDIEYASDENLVTWYTGLQDKNGKEIYEGDIVRTTTGKVMTISWNQRFASFIIDRDGWMFSHWFGEAFEGSDCEVIGNTYEHKHLLV